MNLYIIRHGETVWNTEGRLQGVADVELNENGIRLAKITGEAMKEIPFDLAITSPLKRARQTAELIIGDRPVPILEDSRIQEITFGEWEGLCCRRDHYQIPSPDFLNFFIDPLNYQPPKGGESILQVLERTGSFLQDLVQNPDYQDKTILIASHGCCVRALLNHVYENREDFWRGHVPPNCGVAILQVENGKICLVEEDKIYYDPNEVVDYYAAEPNKDK